MLNQLFKVTLFTSIWLWLKPRWWGLLCLGLYVLLVSFLHKDYLSYAEISEDHSFLVWSYVVKWGLLLVGFLIYLLYSVWSLGGDTKLSTKKEAAKKGSAKKGQDVPAPPANDGFEFLRAKPNLQSRADKILQDGCSEKKKPNAS